MCPVIQNVPFFCPGPILARETLPFSRCIPHGRAKLQILHCKIFRQALMWCIISVEPSCTRERVAVQSPFGGASRLPPKPPWSKGDFALPLNPHRPKSFQCPLETLTNRPPIGCRERFDVQSRPLFRQWMTTKNTFLDAFIFFAILFV